MLIGHDPHKKRMAGLTEPLENPAGTRVNTLSICMPEQGSMERDTHSKALALNLDSSIYGAFAEIGAGQEVARWFLRVGAASGTVAKTMSAYDKIVGDDIYGAARRYVSKERLQAMLDWEYNLLVQRLATTRGESTRFFVFADTAAGRNYQGTNEQHGWAGIRFQTEPGSEPSQVLLHINLRDSTARLQQAAIGILGVNLIYAAFRRRSSVGIFLAGLFDELSTKRIEIDLIRLDGPAFETQDSAEWCLALLCHKMAHAIVFTPRAGVLEPASVLRKRPLVVLRWSFNNAELPDGTLLQRACQQLLTEGGQFDRKPAALLEMTIRHVSGGSRLSPTEVLQHIRHLNSGCDMIVSDFPETYLLSWYLRRYSTEPLRFVMNTASAVKILNETYYQTLPGTLLEGLGRLLAANVKLYVAPMPHADFEAALRDLSRSVKLKSSGNSLIGLNDLSLATPVRHLLDYLRATGQVVALEQPR